MPLVEDIHDLVNILRAQAVLGTILHVARAGVDHEDALARLRILLVDDHDAGGDARAIKQIGWQTDDALDVALAHERAADVGFGIAAEEHAMRQDARAFARALERCARCAAGRRNRPVWRAACRTIETVHTDR